MPRAPLFPPGACHRLPPPSQSGCRPCQASWPLLSTMRRKRQRAERLHCKPPTRRGASCCSCSCADCRPARSRYLRLRGRHRLPRPHHHPGPALLLLRPRHRTRPRWPPCSACWTAWQWLWGTRPAQAGQQQLLLLLPLPRCCSWTCGTPPLPCVSGSTASRPQWRLHLRAPLRVVLEALLLPPGGEGGREEPPLRRGGCWGRRSKARGRTEGGGCSAVSTCGEALPQPQVLPCSSSSSSPVAAAASAAGETCPCSPASRCRRRLLQLPPQRLPCTGGAALLGSTRACLTCLPLLLLCHYSPRRPSTTCYRCHATPLLPLLPSKRPPLSWPPPPLPTLPPLL